MLGYRSQSPTLGIQNTMPLEKEFESMPIPEMSSEFAKAKNILVDGGIDIQKADELVRTCHEKFHAVIKPKIVEEIARRVLRELQERPGVSTLQEMVDIMKKITHEEIKRYTEIEKGEEMKTIYRGLDGIEIKENSLS